MKATIIPIVLWGLWMLVVLGGLIWGVIWYRDSRAAREQNEIAPRSSGITREK
jgi:high-affinity Fe2+/Pb2+ permease